jgi:saccharopine dehydrogenase-like NADP-dependent oxidoreductase
MKTVLLLLSTDRFSIPLIRYLVLEGRRYGWRTCIGSMFDSSFIDNIRELKISSELIFINITDFRQCDHAIRKSDLVIAMIPDILLLQIADSCIEHRKPLVSPSQPTQQLLAKQQRAEENDTLFLLECGFNHGLGHITAKNAIDNIKIKGGSVSSFKTYRGSLIAESEIDNPWGFKLTEPTQDIINTGKVTNRHLIQNQLQCITYQNLFSRSTSLSIAGIRNTIAILEDDSLHLRKVYELNDAHTIIRGRVLRKGFESIWALLVRLGFTNTISKVELVGNQSYVNFLQSLVPFVSGESLEARLKNYAGATDDDIEKLYWLGAFGEDWPEGYSEITPAIILQHLLEQKFSMKPHEKDCIVMRHELEYTTSTHFHSLNATLLLQGEDLLNSAMAKAIGLTTGAAAKAVLIGDIQEKGIHTPVKKEIYQPILNELIDLGMTFHMDEKKIRKNEASSHIETSYTEK